MKRFILMVVTTAFLIPLALGCGEEPKKTTPAPGGKGAPATPPPGEKKGP